LFEIVFFDDCADAIIDASQKIQTIIYYITNTGSDPNKASIATFSPFTDSISDKYHNATICGQKLYSINDTLPFVSLHEPAEGSTKWTIAVQTANVSHVGHHEVALQARLASFPSA
jgi:hypothetical protein